MAIPIWGKPADIEAWSANVPNPTLDSYLIFPE
jgi:hypothetical protein